jgi:hypothetical protein
MEHLPHRVREWEGDRFLFSDAGARPASREPFNRVAGFPNPNRYIYRLPLCRELSDRRRNKRTSQRDALCRFARRSRETSYLSTCSIRELAGNTDIPAWYK